MTNLKRYKNSIIILIMLSFTVFVFLYSLTVASFPLYFSEVTEGLMGKIRFLLFQTPATLNSFLEQELLYENLPRSLAGLVIGAALSAAGCAYQGIFRNPKVSPDFLGASTGAGFGAALAIALGWSQTAVMTSAFGFGLIAVASAYLISLRSRGNHALTLLLAGIMISALFDSAISYIEIHVDSYAKLPEITFWLMGSLWNVGYSDLAFAAPSIVFGTLLLFILRWPVNLLSMGEDEARTMGVGTNLVRGLAIIAATLLTAASVSISGKIGWIGLVIPHFSRRLVGYDNRVLLPVSMLMGGCYLMLVDVLAHFRGYDLPLGIFTAFVGAPFFFFLILSRRNRM